MPLAVSRWIFDTQLEFYTQISNFLFQIFAANIGTSKADSKSESTISEWKPKTETKAPENPFESEVSYVGEPHRVQSSYEQTLKRLRAFQNGNLNS